MSSTQSSGASETVLIIFALIIVSAVRRTYNMYRGTRFSMGRTLTFGAVYIGLGVVFSATSFSEGVSILLAPVYGLIVAAAGVVSYLYSDRRVTFWYHGDGSLYFRGGVVIYLIYLLGLVVRLAIDYAVIGPDFLSPTLGTTLSGSSLEGLVATDLLLMLGVGLLLGRSLRVVARYRRIERGEDTVPNYPPPLGHEGSRSEFPGPQPNAG